jgi:hypothetical protein
MKVLSIVFILFFAVSLFAEDIIIFKEGVTSIPTDVENEIRGDILKVKKGYTGPFFHILSLPRDEWEKTREMPNMAVLVTSADIFNMFPHPSIKVIMENTPIHQMRTEPDYNDFGPLACENAIYWIGPVSTANQNLTREKPCDGFFVRPKAAYNPMTIKVKPATGKTIEVYEHGELIAEGTSPLNVNFQYGYRHRYVVVRGTPGAYKIYAKISMYDYQWHFDLPEWSNAFGFGVLSAELGAEKILNRELNENNDTEFLGAKLANAPAVWAEGHTGKGMIVAVVDTGVDSNHPFLKDHMLKGYNVPDDSSDSSDPNGHGTHVAGIIHQVAPDAKILPVRVLGKNGSASSDDVIKGIRWAIDNGADVINISLGSNKTGDDSKNVMKYGRSKGVLFAMAAGNGNEFEPIWPARYAEKIKGLGYSVGSVDHGGRQSFFSAYAGTSRSSHHVMGYGARVLSTVPGGKWESMSGTSMAAPHVAGLLALLKSIQPRISAEELQNIADEAVFNARILD